MSIYIQSLVLFLFPFWEIYHSRCFFKRRLPCSRNLISERSARARSLESDEKHVGWGPRWIAFGCLITG